MAWPETLTATQQALITNYVDQVLRPAMLPLVKAFASASAQVLPAYLTSPSGATSTFAAPAADSIAAVLATIPGADIVPLSAQNPTGLALAQPLTAAEVISYTTALNTLLTTWWTLAFQQAYSNIIGAPNV